MVLCLFLLTPGSDPKKQVEEKWGHCYIGIDKAVKSALRCLLLFFNRAKSLENWATKDKMS